jgi:hypothetical protein
MMSTISGGTRFVGIVSVAVVAVVAAVVSYAHMQAVAEKAGEGWRSWLEPLSVDGLLVGASLVLYVRRSARFAWLAVAVGILVSLAANLAAAHPTLVSRLVSAWPAIALALSYETLLTLVRQTPADSVDTVESTQDQSNQEQTPAVNGHMVDDDEIVGTNGRVFGDPEAWARVAR